TPEKSGGFLGVLPAKVVPLLRFGSTTEQASAGQGNQIALHIGDDQFREFFQGLDMRALPAMRGVERKADQADAKVPACIDGRRAVRAVGTERVALMSDSMVLRQLEQMLRN